ncbi:hypothetical protein ABZZ47_15985 [Streptomyces sp. NPDC006465]|uniref:hypothetical protein n=1 Tax=Streptomyces sp. NPDC006465 TaxID=3157174 RepID=UPI0033B0F649
MQWAGVSRRIDPGPPLVLPKVDAHHSATPGDGRPDPAADAGAARMSSAAPRRPGTVRTLRPDRDDTSWDTP